MTTKETSVGKRNRRMQLKRTQRRVTAPLCPPLPIHYPSPINMHEYLNSRKDQHQAKVGVAAFAVENVPHGLPRPAVRDIGGGDVILVLLVHKAHVGALPRGAGGLQFFR